MHCCWSSAITYIMVKYLQIRRIGNYWAVSVFPTTYKYVPCVKPTISECRWPIWRAQTLKYICRGLRSHIWIDEDIVDIGQCQFGQTWYLSNLLHKHIPSITQRKCVNRDISIPKLWQFSIFNPKIRIMSESFTCRITQYFISLAYMTEYY